MHFVYVVLSYVVFGLALPLLVYHRKLRQGIRRRFGLYTRQPWPKPHTEGKKIWFHGASAGDLIALRPTIEHIRHKDPDAVIVISTMTNSGYEIAKTK
ncbi:MAG: glycosyltransferase N-terminal domain-containing protein, partial [Myxococcota bacterium]|nr:glycosyltransferase N-terminal domain-containing protein [Myxococcota bacterium]